MHYLSLLIRFLALGFGLDQNILRCFEVAAEAGIAVEVVGARDVGLAYLDWDRQNVGA